MNKYFLNNLDYIEDVIHQERINKIDSIIENDDTVYAILDR